MQAWSFEEPGTEEIAWQKPEIDSVNNYQELGGGLPELDGFELTPLYCDDSPTYGMMVYDVHAPEKKRAFLFHEWSCGSGGCSVKLELHTREETLTAISGMPPCSEESEE